MDTLVYVGVGAVVGAVMGSGTGFAVGKYKQHAKSKHELMQSLIKDEDEAQRRKSEEQANQTVEATPAAADTTSVASTVQGDKTSVVAPTAVVEEKPIAVAKPVDPKHDVFGVKTTYFSSTTGFFTPMSRFETFLQFKEEREAFRRAVEHVDHLLGMDTLLHGRNPLSAASMPTIAQSARNKALRLLHEIAKFSNKRRPSPTKEKDMLQIIDEIRQEMDEIISSMHKTVAATPFVPK